MTVVLGERFELLECLGKGGMAEVYRARDRRLGRDVAIKLLNAMCSRDPALIERFRQESSALAQLSNPRIVTLLDTGETADGRFYLVMERLLGEGLDSLFRRLRARGEVMPWARLAAIVRQVCSALQAAHSRQIVHRDIKPSNLFRLDEAPDGEDFIKILDFGIAKILASAEAGIGEDRVHLTASGMFVGTAHFAAPELIEPEKYGPVGPQADVYALGVILYQGVAGVLPYEGEPRSKVLYKTAFDEPPPLRSRTARSIAPAIEAVVMRAIAREPTRRFASVRELAEAIAAVPEAEVRAHETPVARGGGGKGPKVLVGGAGARDEVLAGAELAGRHGGALGAGAAGQVGGALQANAGATGQVGGALGAGAAGQVGGALQANAGAAGQVGGGLQANGGAAGQVGGGLQANGGAAGQVGGALQGGAGAAGRHGGEVQGGAGPAGWQGAVVEPGRRAVRWAPEGLSTVQPDRAVRRAGRKQGGVVEAEGGLQRGASGGRMGAAAEVGKSPRGMGARGTSAVAPRAVKGEPVAGGEPGENAGAIRGGREDGRSLVGSARAGRGAEKVAEVQEAAGPGAQEQARVREVAREVQGVGAPVQARTAAAQGLGRAAEGRGRGVEGRGDAAAALGVAQRSGSGSVDPQGRTSRAISGEIEDAGASSSTEPGRGPRNTSTGPRLVAIDALDTSFPGSVEVREGGLRANLGVIVAAVILTGVILGLWWVMPPPPPERPSYGVLPSRAGEVRVTRASETKGADDVRTERRAGSSAGGVDDGRPGRGAEISAASPRAGERDGGGDGRGGVGGTGNGASTMDGGGDGRGGVGGTGNGASTMDGGGDGRGGVGGTGNGASTTMGDGGSIDGGGGTNSSGEGGGARGGMVETEVDPVLVARTRERLRKLAEGMQATVEACADGHVLRGAKIHALAVSLAASPDRQAVKVVELKTLPAGSVPLPEVVRKCALDALRKRGIAASAPAEVVHEFLVR